MNNNKICFIMLVNNDKKIKNDLYGNIKLLSCPKGYEIEYIEIENAISLANGFNSGQSRSDAKFKIYMDQNTNIVNANFIKDFISIFDENDRIGMLGMTGTQQVPVNGDLHSLRSKVGSLYEIIDGQAVLKSYVLPNQNYEKVQVLDGFIVVTSHDIPWREDYNEDIYAVAATCMEFWHAGYEVVVPKQLIPWCSIAGNLKSGDALLINRHKFLDEFSKDLFPLVSILIPSYNQTVYLKLALESAINQTYRNIEIIIGDDSINEDVESFVKPYLQTHSNIIYFKNEKKSNDFGISNSIHCFEKSNGEYVNFLFHDDLYKHNKIERMMDYMINYSQLSMVTSFRQTIDMNGNDINLGGAFQKLFEQDVIIDGKELSRLILVNLTNFIGEPTTVLFKKECLNDQYIFRYGEYNFSTLVDVAMWLSLVENGKCAYIAEALSCFRIHGEQNSNNPEIHLNGNLEWFKLLNIAFERGVFTSSEDYRQALLKMMIQTLVFMREIAHGLSNNEFGLSAEFLKAAKIIFFANGEK
jgi:glycosyltransferase involved in cell wall biosynthesis